MSIDLYYKPGSSPCRAVRLVAAALGVKLNLITCDLMKGEHLKPEYLKMNPQHTIPTMDDNGFYLFESRAIMMYLADQYGKDDSLYPKDVKERAVVNQRLFFDLGTLYQSFAEYYYPQIFAKAPKNEENYKKIATALGFLDKFLEGENYVAGKHLTIADLALVTSVSNFEVMDYDFSSYKNVTRWYSKVKKEAKDYEGTNGEGMKAFKGLVEYLKNA